MSTRKNNISWIALNIFLLILLLTPPNICLKFQLPIHRIPIVMRQCLDVASPVQSATGKFTSSGFREFPLLSNNSSRFMTDYTDVNGLTLSRPGTCMVPGLREFQACAFVIFDEGVNVKIYNLSISAQSTGCPKDTRSMIKAWDTMSGHECLLDFGSSCCLYERDEHEEDTVPKLFSWLAAVVFLLVVLKIVGVVFAKNNQIIAVRPIEPWVGG